MVRLIIALTLLTIAHTVARSHDSGTSDSTSIPVADCSLMEELSSMEIKRLATDERFLEMLVSLRPLEGWAICDEYYNCMWISSALGNRSMSELAFALLALARALRVPPLDQDSVQPSVKFLLDDMWGIADRPKFDTSIARDSPFRMQYEWAATPFNEWRRSIGQETDYMVSNVIYKLSSPFVDWVAESVYKACQHLNSAGISSDEFIHDMKIVLSSVIRPRFVGICR